MFHIQILNKSNLITDAELKPIVAALQKQVDEHFAPAYHLSAKLVLTDKDNGMTPIHIVDSVADAPSGALAWHDVDNKGRPFGIIPMKIVRKDRAHPGPTISHELLELMADPGCELYRLTLWPPKSQRQASVAYEVCDPVEDNEYPIKTTAGTAKVSNFVLPSWFLPESKRPWDHLKKLTAPLKMTHGGYLQWHRTGTHWRTINAKHVRAYRAKPHYFSRTVRRLRNMQELLYPGYHEMVREAALRLRSSGAGPEAIEALADHLVTTLGRDPRPSVDKLVSRLLKRK